MQASVVFCRGWVQLSDASGLLFDVLCMEYSQQVNKNVGITPRRLFKPETIW